MWLSWRLSFLFLGENMRFAPSLRLRLRLHYRIISQLPDEHKVVLATMRE